MNQTTTLETEFFPSQERNSRALMIMLHGLGDSIEGYRWLPEAMNLPWMNYLLVNAPDAYYTGFSWYDFAGDIVPGVQRSAKLLFNVLDTQRKAGFPTEQTIFTGFSQGSLMSIEVGLRYPKKFAGIVGISGYVCAPEKLVKEMSPVAGEQRLLITHGTEDTMIPIAKVREQMDILMKAGLLLQWQEFSKAHTIAGEEELGIVREFIRAGFSRR